MFIDTHAHLTDERFDEDREEIIKKAFDSMTEKIITSGVNLENSKQAVKLAEEYENIYASIGVHPQDVDGVEDNTLKEIERLASSKKVVAIGEIGLEYLENSPDRELQNQVFIEQILLAEKLCKPLPLSISLCCKSTYSFKRLQYRNLFKTFFRNGDAFVFNVHVRDHAVRRGE